MSGATRVLLSFSSAYSHLAQRVAADLRSAGLEVIADKWYGGGGVPATRAVPLDLEGVAFVLPLITPSDAAPVWINDDWKRQVLDPAIASHVVVLPMRGDGNPKLNPGYLSEYTFVDLGREYDWELRRLLDDVRQRTGDNRIVVPAERDDPPHTAASADPLVLELGETLSAAIGDTDGMRKFHEDDLPMMYDGLYYEMGVRFPDLQIRVRPEVPASALRVVINGVPEHQAEVLIGFALINERPETLTAQGLPDSRPGINPASNAACGWIANEHVEAAKAKGFTTWDTLQFFILTLSAVLRRKAADFIDEDQAQGMLDQAAMAFPLLVAETVPGTVSPFLLTDVLRRLLIEEISIRNIRRILMALADFGRHESDPMMLTEYARAALQRQITHQLSRGTNEMVVFLLHPDIERTIAKAIRHTRTGSYLDLEPGRTREILDAIQNPVRRLPDDVQMPQILTTMEIRSTVRRLVAPVMPRLRVVSYQELRPDTAIQPVGRIALDGFTPRPGVTAGGVPLWAE